MISVHLQGKPCNITVIQVYAPTSNTEETEVEWFYEDLQDLLELTPKKDVLSIIGDWNAKVGSQETPLWNGLRHLGESRNGGTTLQVLSPFLWRAPPLEMRWECREFFPDQSWKGSP